jgi:hypothetical protein
MNAGLRRFCKKPEIKAGESRGVRRTPVRRSDEGVKPNAEIGFFTGPSALDEPMERPAFDGSVKSPRSRRANPEE